MNVIYDPILDKARSDAGGTSSGVSITTVEAASANSYSQSVSYTNSASSNLVGYINGRPSGGASSFDGTIGTGGTYATIAAALTAGKKTLLAVGNSTEVGNITLPTSGSISLTIPRGITVALATYYFVYSGTCDVYINGEGTLSRGTTVDGRLFSNGIYTSSIVKIDGVTLDSSAAGATTVLTDGCIERISNLTVLLADVAYTGFYGAEFSTYDNLVVNGGGSSCEKPWLQGKCTINNLLITGNFNKIDGWENATVLSGLRMKTSGAFNCFLYGNTTGATWAIGAGNFEIAQRANVSNIRCVGSATVTFPNRYTIVNNVRVETDVSISGQENQITNLYCANKGITVEATADNCGLINCFAGDEGSGGAKTITIDAGAVNTRVIGCLTDVAIVNNGTSSVLSGNAVF